jgi:type II secretory pathway pseudopilin PulG
MISRSIRKQSERHDLASTAAGFSLIELLVSASILIVATSVFVWSTRIAFSSSRSGDAIIQVQSLVSRDLQWLRAYAHTWNCISGCSGDSASSPLRYAAASCGSLVSSFLSAAAASTDTPPRPFAIPLSPDTSQGLPAINGSTLTRTISLPSIPSGTTGSLPQSLVVTYTYPGTPAFTRRATVLIQAGSWCTP